MTRYFLRQISLEGFRGINNSGQPLVLTFKPDCVNSIHAQNAVGKTSIFEALQFAIKGEIPRLTNLQEGEQGGSYVVNKFHPGHVATIELIFAPDDGGADTSIKVTRTAGGTRTVTSPSGHPAPEEFLRSLDEDFVLVDYQAFTGFIDATALVRGRSFAALIGLSSYSRLRQALEGANHSQTIRNDLGLTVLETQISSERHKVADAKTRVVDAYKDLTAEQITDISDRPALEAKVTNVLCGIGTLKKVMEGKAVDDFDYKAAVAAIEAEEDSENRRKLVKMREDRDAIRELTFAAEHTAQIDALLQVAGDRDAAVAKVGSSEVLELLKSTSKILGTSAWPDDGTCPVCDLPQPSPLKNRVDEKIDLYSTAKELDGALCAQSIACPAIALLSKLETAAAMAIPTDQHVARPIIDSAKKGCVPTADIKQASVRLGELTVARDEKVAELETSIKQLEESLPPSVVAASRAVENAKRFRDEFGNHAKASDTLKGLLSKWKKLQRWRSFIDKAAKTFADAETGLSTARLQSIEQSYKALFPLLMRGAPDLKPQLTRAATSQNVDLVLSDFYGQTGVNARAVLSESYRNAVAASIFLSSAVNSTRPPRFMVLDDVTSSFDGGHQFFLMDALRTKLRHGAIPDGIQFIVLSHDSALEKYFDKLGNTQEWHHQKLQGLPPKGAVLSTAQDADRLKQMAVGRLNIGDVELGGPLVRQYMEFKLGYIVAKLQIPVPPDYATRPDTRTLSTYLNAITKAVELYDKAQTCVLQPAQVTAVRQTATTSLMSNLVSHYETSVGQPLNAHALLGVIGEIDAYAENFRRADPNNPNQRIYYKKLDQA